MIRPRSRQVLAMAALVAACSTATGCQRALVCDVSVLSVRTGQIAPGDALPPGTEHILTAGDFDSRGASIAPAETGTEVQLQLHTGVVQRFREYTSANVGGFMAITLNGSVVAVPQIQAEIPDGSLRISLPDTEQEAVDAFATCIRGRALPEP